MKNKAILFLAILFMIACNSAKNQPLFKEGRQFYYAVTRYEPGQLVSKDTISFKTGGFSVFNLAGNGTKITWYNSRGQQISARTVTTTLTNQDTTYSLDMPTNYSLLENEMVLLPGTPYASLKSKPGAVSFTESGAVAGYGKLNGRTLKQERHQLSDTMTTWHGKQYLLKRYESRNVSDTADLGLVRFSYAFNKELGFVYLDYHLPDSVEVKIDLIRIEEPK